ncbi:MAG: hypothetical protein KDD82_02835 [Planctomycetes bacterium]|nr:hypothetical protein [Planctomycetota bacterium]
MKHTGGASKAIGEGLPVQLASDWLDRWMIQLDQSELRAYLQLAHWYNTRTYHDEESLSRILPGKNVRDSIKRLERRGLIEVIRRGTQYHYHFPHRDRDGFHRAERARPSLSEALAFQETMSEELTGLTEKDETDKLRARVFKRYPQLREEFSLYETKADPGAPRWRLWMELSSFLIREFEERFGSLRDDHGELFKEVSAKVLQHHLDVVDGVVREILQHIGELFVEVQLAWVIAPSEQEFVALPFVRNLAQRYKVGPEQIFLNTLEELGARGRIVVVVDPDGYLSDMILSSDTGLTKSEERVLFLRPEERAQQDSERNRERVRRARNKYANYHMARAVGVLADFVAARRVRDIDAWLERIVDLVNDALSLLPMNEGARPVLLEHVMDQFDAVRQGIDTVASRVRLAPLVDETGQTTADKAARPKPAKSKKDKPQKKAGGKGKKQAAAKKGAKAKPAKKKPAKKKPAKKKPAKKKPAKKKKTARR